MIQVISIEARAQLAIMLDIDGFYEIYPRHIDFKIETAKYLRAFITTGISTTNNKNNNKNNNNNKYITVSSVYICVCVLCIQY